MPQKHQQEQEQGKGREQKQAEASHAGDATRRRTRFYLVRHGERYDEVPFNDWYEESPETKILYDPPLTAQGKDQARLVAETYIATREDLDDVSLIYSSRMSRCISTAAEIAKVMDWKIAPARGLAECAAAIRERTVERSRFADDDTIADLVKGKAAIDDSVSVDTGVVLRNRELMGEHPRVKGKEASEDGDGGIDVSTKPTPKSIMTSHDMQLQSRARGYVPITFRDTIVHLCEKHEGDGVFVCCSHREGIRDLMRYCGFRLNAIGYCATAAFEYDHDHDTFHYVCHDDRLLRVQNLPHVAPPRTVNPAVSHSSALTAKKKKPLASIGGILFTKKKRK